ncbi:MAG: hypothetical protein ACI86H_001294 [bacterium]
MIGSVAEIKSEIGDQTRSSYGAGFRFFSASGFTYRIDLATGKEGVEPTIFFGCPW